MCWIASLFLLQRLKGSMSRDARDFNNIETRIFFSLQCKASKEIHALLTETLGDMHHLMAPSNTGWPSLNVRQTSMSSAGFEPTIPARERPQTHSLDRTATDIGYTVRFSLNIKCRFQWPRGLRRRSAAARLLKLWVRIPQVAWMSICCECCVLSSKDLCDETITRPEESYRTWCVVVCDLETSWMRRPWPTGGCRVKNQLYT